MKFTLSWLRKHLDTDADAGAIGERLTAIGLEVEAITNPADALRPFRVARVLEAVPHPNADKLRLLKVDDGSGEPWQVVCGAPNARTGLVGVFGPPGAFVPGPAFTLKPTRIRDVESFGMMCSSRELLLGDEHDGIIELAPDAPVGASFADHAGLDDPLFDVAITPNRQDCLGVRGIARDLAASGMGTLRPLAKAYGSWTDPVAADGPGPDVRTDDPDGCPAFFAQAVTGVTNRESPEWMRRKLMAVGQKPISALVDITNFLSLDLGRPLHVYDRAKLTGPLVARRAREGETIDALNGKTYALAAGMTVIADDAAVHDIGGIMGGAHSGVSDATTDVIIECAWFDPEAIARTGQALNLTSDARQRFERGVDPAFLEEGLAIATRMVLAHCGGAASTVTRAGTPPAEARSIAYRPAQCAALGGMEVAVERQRKILAALGFGIESQGDQWSVEVPSWRRDVHGPADVVEEVVRMVGLDAVPSTPLPRAAGVAPPTATPLQLRERKLRRAAAARGMTEALTWSFLPEKDAGVFGGGAFALANPISEDMKVMRPSLLPGLVGAARRNLDRGASSVRLFEIGRRYLAEGERPTLGLVLAGDAAPRDWRQGKARGFDAFDAKAEMLALLEAAGAPADKLQVMGDAGAHYHPGQSATLRLGPKTVLAAFGVLHPEAARAMGLKARAVAAELFIDAIPARKAGGFLREAYAPPPLQAVTRDFAFLADATLAAGELVRAVRGADKQHIVDARLFDRFEGEGVPEGKVSLAVEVTLQPADKSFDEAALKAISDRVVAAVAKLGATLRG